MALIAVSGHLKDVSGANIAGSVVFQLVNYGASIPRVIGTNALVPTNVTFTAAASGAWSGNIQGNDSIDPGASNTPPTTYYVCQFRDQNGANIQAVPFSFTGAGPSNLDSQAPLVTIPSPTAPPNTAALLAATQTFTGNNTFQGTTTISAATIQSQPVSDHALPYTTNASDSILTISGTGTLTFPPTAGKIWTIFYYGAGPMTIATSSGVVFGPAGIPSGNVPGIVFFVSSNGTNLYVGGMESVVTFKKGSGSGNYSGPASTSYQNVDGTNLLYTITIPIGWKLLMWAVGSISTNTAAVNTVVSFADGGATLAPEVNGLPTAIGVNGWVNFSVASEITGDGNSHVVTLQAKSTNASDSYLIQNANATATPVMTFLLAPSN